MRSCPAGCPIPAWRRWRISRTAAGWCRRRSWWPRRCGSPPTRPTASPACASSRATGTRRCRRTRRSRPPPRRPPGRPRGAAAGPLLRLEADFLDDPPPALELGTDELAELLGRRADTDLPGFDDALGYHGIGEGGADFVPQPAHH